MKLIEVKGPDAQDFLHRLTAGTVKNVGTGEGARGLLLTGQGRMRAQFDLLRIDAQRFWLAAPDACSATLFQELEAKHFSEDLVLRWREEEWGYEEGTVPSGSGGVFPLSHGVTGSLWPSPVSGYRGALDAGPLPQRFHFDRIGALVPWPEFDWDENSMALEAGTLPWIDRAKGCYPGQEVIEKSLNVGHPPRVLNAFEGTVAVERGAKLSFDGGGEALVTSVAEWEGVTRVLARVPWAQRAAHLPGFRLMKSHW